MTDSAWEYVSLYLKRKSSEGIGDALFYWEQAHSFYLASLALPDEARPLTSYYCILNASKALLRANKIVDSSLGSHGISSVRSVDNKTSLRDAMTVVKGAGVLPELSMYFDSYIQPGKYSIYSLLYNVPCIHRAFSVTFTKPEMFVPISKPVFVKKAESKESWIKFVVDGRYASDKALKKIPSKFNRDTGISEDYVLRMKERFEWDIHEQDISKRKDKMTRYHRKLRKYIYYICGAEKLWYIKKEVAGNELLSTMNSSVLIFAVFHWLSELVRYDPKLFRKYMESKQNWLLHEFIHKALDQFIDEISCEITGRDIMCSGYRK